MKKFIEELKRRNVIKAAIAYLVAAWLILQVISTVLPPLGTPEWVIRTFTVLIILGFPFWLVFSWVYEVTDEGIKRTASVKDEETLRPVTNKRLNVLIVILLVVAIGLNFLSGSNNLSFSGEDSPEIHAASIAVLPFDDMSSEGDSQWFCDGITDDILTHLALISDIKVISRTSTERYRNTEKAVPDIARELEVNYVVEGSVSIHEGEFMLNVQLIDLNDDHVWAEIFRDDFKEVFEIRENISRQIAKKLKIAISPKEESALKRTPTENMDAYELVMRARSLIDQDWETNRKQTEKLLDSAISLDPGFADAYAYKAYMIVRNIESYGVKGLQERDELIEKALELDPENLVAILNKADQAWYYRDFEEAKRWLDKAISINANSAKAHHYLSFQYSMTGNLDWDKAVYHSRKAHELDPFSAEITRDHYTTLNLAGHYEEARDLLEGSAIGWTDDEKWWLGTWWKGVAMNDRVYVGRQLMARLEQDPGNARLQQEMGRYYDGILNNNVKYLEHAKRAYELEPGEIDYLREYLQALAENKKREEFMELIDSVDFKKYDRVDMERNIQMFALEYQTGNYNEALNIIEEAPMEVFHLRKLIAITRLEDSTALEAHLKKFKVFMGVHHWATYYAIKGNRDSLYYYLNTREIEPTWVNSRMEFDPYRNDKRYKEFLRKNGFPLREDYKDIDLELKQSRSLQ